MSVIQVRTLSRTDEARGLFWLMEEEVLQPGGSEETLLQRLFSYYGPAEGESTGHTHIHAQTHNTRTLTFCPRPIDALYCRSHSGA